jgi:photosystem II stability/assembly factor-like uncharacterized protein
MRARFAAIIAVLLCVGCTEEAPQPTERWVVEELGTRAEFQDVFFLDAQRGWIVGGGHNIGGGIIGRTTDGGRTWSLRSAVVRPSSRASSFHLNAIWFVDEQTGFIVGDGFNVLRSVDGGEHWHKLLPAHRVSAHLRDLQFVDREYGWAIGIGGLIRTVDGGASWDGPLLIDPEADHRSHTTGMALHFLDRQRGWIVGQHGLIRMSVDGGESWIEVNGPQKSEKPDLWGIEFSDDLHGWAVGEHGTILHTADGGKNWKRQTSGVRDILMDVDFVDASQGWAVGFDPTSGSATVLWTTDGGTTWTEQARVGSESMRALFVLDERHAWAVGHQQRRTPEDGSQKLLRYEVNEPRS